MTRQTKSFAVLLITLLVAQYALLVSPAHAQDPPDPPPIDPANLLFETVEGDYSAPYAILEDSDGFIWLAGSSAVYKYNGYDFETIISKRCGALFEDSEGLIWMSTPDGVSVYDKTTGTVTEHSVNPDDPKKLNSNMTLFQDKQNVFAEDAQGNIWLGANNGLHRYDKTTNTFTAFLSRPDDESTLLDNAIRSVMADTNGMFWVGTATGLHQFNPKTGTVITRYPYNNDDPAALHGTGVHALCEDDAGNIWIATEGGGLSRLNPSSGELQHFRFDPENGTGLSDNNVLALTIRPDMPHLLWIGTMSGLDILDMETNSFVHYLYDDENPDPEGVAGIVYHIIWDRSGILWITAAHTAVLQKSDPGAIKFQSVVSTCDSEIGPDGNVWWMMLPWPSNSIQRYNPETDEFTLFQHDPDRPDSLPEGIRDIYIDPQSEYMWIISDNNLYAYDFRDDRIVNTFETGVEGTGNKWPLWQNRINSDILYGSVWGQGWLRFDKNSGQFSMLRQDENNPEETFSSSFVGPVFGFAPDPNILWGNTGGGYDLFDLRTGKVIRKIPFNDSDFKGDDFRTNGGLQDSQGRWWLGYNRYDPATGTFTQFRDIYGYEWPSGQVTSIVEDDKGMLWFSGNVAGTITRLDPETGDIQVFSRQDGVHPTLACGPSTIDTMSDGRFVVSGTGGTTFWHPDDIIDNPYRAPVYITQLSQGGIPLELAMAPERAQEIILDWDDNFFEFEAAALSYRRNNQNQYQYKLEGWDEEWYNAGTLRQGRYSGLEEGMYVLQVKGSNNDGVWSDQVAELKISVEPNIPAGQTVFSLDEMQSGPAIQLPFNQNSFTLEAIPLDYDLVGQEVSYMLEGFDNDWKDLGSRRYVNYENVADGRYTFKVKAGDEEMVAKKMTIAPPFTRSMPFYGLIAAGVLALFGGVYYVSMNQLRARQALRESQLQAQAAEAEAEKAAAMAQAQAAQAESEAERAATMQTLNTVSQQVTGILDLDRLLEQVVTLTKERFAYYHCHIYLLNEARDTLVLTAGYGEAGQKMIAKGHSIPREAEQSLVARASREKAVVHVDDVRDDPTWLPNELLPDTHAEMAVPILQEERCLGVLDVQSDKVGALDEADADLLRSLANQVAIALNNAGLFDQISRANAEIRGLNERLKSENMRMEAELEVTSRLQQMLLPSADELNRIEGLEIAGFMEPAEEVGGDYYDVLHHNGRVKIGMGDVTGHGLESGVVMLMAQTAVRTLLMSGVEDAADFLGVVNRLLYANLQRMGVEKSMTLALLDYRPQERQMRVSGQHEHLLVVRAGGQVEVRDTMELGIPVGLVEEVGEYVSEEQIKLQPGEVLVLYSDGFTEAENEAGEFYGLERLCAVVARHWAEPAAGIKAAVVEDVKAFIGQQVVYDDLALLVIKQQ